MTNAEYYLKEGIDLNDFANEMSSNFGIATPRSESDYDVILYLTDVKKWLKAKVKPTLTEDERAILSNIDENEYQKIARQDGALFLIGDNSFYDGRNTCFMFGTIFKSDLFQFIKDGEEYEIKELLNGD